MVDENSLREYYRALTDGELLNLKSEGGFTKEAEHVLGNELARRKLASRDVKRFAAEKQLSKLHDEVRERGGGYRELGLQFFGRSYLSKADREANIQVRTKWFTMSGIPLFPLASYRFKCTAGSKKWFQTSVQQQVIERVPLNWDQVFLIWGKLTLAIIGVILLIVGIAEGIIAFKAVTG